MLQHLLDMGEIPNLYLAWENKLFLMRHDLEYAVCFLPHPTSTGYYVLSAKNERKMQYKLPCLLLCQNITPNMYFGDNFIVWNDIILLQT